MSKTLIFALIVLSIDAAVPRPELPQPQFARPDWQTLNGEWEFDFDDANTGLRDNWAVTKKSLARKITVPYAFETKLSGIGDTSFHPWVWYRRTVQIPANWASRRVLLHFGAIDYRAMIWVNGRLAGQHEGGNVPIKLDVTDFLTPTGPQAITVRAEDPPEDRY